MDELIKQVTAKSGITEDQAGKAVETVLGFLQDGLPGSVVRQIDDLLNSDVGDVPKRSGGLLDHLYRLIKSL